LTTDAFISKGLPPPARW